MGKFSSEVWDTIVLEYERGHSTTTLSRQYKVSVQSILYQIRKRGIAVRVTAEILKQQVERRHFDDMKLCPCCEKIKTFEEFYRVDDRSDGLHRNCKDCLSRKTKELRQRMTPEQLSKLRDRQKIARLKYMSTETGLKNSRKAAYRNYTSVKGRWLACKSAQRRKNRTWTLTLDEYENLIVRSCHYCGGPLPKTSSGLDRKDNSRGYEIDNVLPCCTICNLSRRNHFTVEEMEKFIGPAIREIREVRARAWKSIDESSPKKGDVFKGKVCGL